MGTKPLSHLDPKLQAAYDRVMNSASAGMPPTQTVRTPKVATPINLPHQNPQESRTKSTRPVMVTTQLAPNSPVPMGTMINSVIQQPQPSYQTGMQNQFAMNQPVALSPQGYLIPAHPAANKSNGEIFKIVFIILGIIFFVLYIVFWIQLFRLNVPLGTS